MLFNKQWTVRVGMIFAVIGPGIIAGTANNDAGGTATYSIAGAHFGYSLLWLLIPTGLILWLTQDMGVRLGLVTGKGLSALIRENFDIRMSVFVIAATAIANWATVVAEFAGIASVAHIYNIPKIIPIILSTAAIAFIVIKGNFNIVQRVFLTSSVLYLSYIFAGILGRPDWLEAMKGITMPQVHLENDFLFTAIALVGTTVTAWGQFFVQSYYVDKGVRFEGLRLVRWDVAMGAFWTVLIAFFIIIATASTLWVKNITIHTMEDAAFALVPLAGSLAKHLFAWGLLNASLLGASVVTISASYMVTESFGWEGKVEHGMKESPTFYKLFLAYLITAALFVMIPRLPLVVMLLIPQALNTFVLPIIFISLLTLLNRRDIMGNHVNTKWYNVGAVIAIGTVVLLNLLYLFSLIKNALTL